MVSPADLLGILAIGGDVADNQTDRHGRDEDEDELTGDGEWIRHIQRFP